ncbi:nucleoside triphosphate pyrophosphohydrolase [Exiguobacterium oxidotolerans]|uniref:nucleoside triphosphate pyrophosphohydrolase n=1 Tax=Exiguobacterium oxidotolerans TaxID=223958 RepID=UPI0004945A67|nr:nucleoside triphosphate pyrophosphohydrolase [Exiguobacterium oxidotolerans]
MTHRITVVGLGVGELEQLPFGVYKLLKETTQPVYLRTADHPVVSELATEGMKFTSFDSIYERHDRFEAVYADIVETLLEQAKQEAVIYAVPGHPLVAESTVQQLLARATDIDIVGGQSFLDPMFAAVGVDPIEGFQLLDATAFRVDEAQIRQHVLIGQVYDAFVAGDLKVMLMERYPDEHPVTLVTAAGTSKQHVMTVPLYELDRVTMLSNLTTVYVPPVTEEKALNRDFATLKDIIARLRGEGGCPWDQEQTHESLKKHLIEESYELLEAIDLQDDNLMIEELGDVLLQVMLHAQIGLDEGYFDIRDVIGSVSDKMIRRHPHVFAEATVDSAADVVANWQTIKSQEKPERKYLLDGVTKGAPALMRAEQIQKKVAKVGFEWDTVSGALEKVQEEIRELQEAPPKEQLAEFGDLLFSLVLVGKYMGLSGEEALQLTNDKFIRRFTRMEQLAKRPVEELSLDEQDQLWNQAKQEEQS